MSALRDLPVLGDAGPLPAFLARTKQDTKMPTPAVAVVAHVAGLPALIDRAAQALTGARTAAEVLEARDMAAVAYDAAKIAARFAKAKQAHDDVVAAAYRAQADALEIEAQAKRRLADEYDAAQERGEVATGRDGPGAGVTNGNAKATTEDLGLTRKDIHEARRIRDAENADPGIVHRTLAERLERGEEPTKAALRKTLRAAAPAEPSADRRRAKKPKRRLTVVSANTETQHDRDLRLLEGAWEAACQSARDAFLSKLGHGNMEAA